MIVVPKLLRILDHTWETFRKKNWGSLFFRASNSLSKPLGSANFCGFFFPVLRLSSFRSGVSDALSTSNACYTRLIAERTIWIEAFLHFVD